MQLPYRATQRITPQSGETLIRSREEALHVLADIESRLTQKMPAHHRAPLLNARATLYQALGDRKMLEASQDAYKFCKSADTALLLGTSLSHFGRAKEAAEMIERAYKQPHPEGFEVDMSYGSMLLAVGHWSDAYKILKTAKKSMVYAMGLPRWYKGHQSIDVSVISEGGFGDLIMYSRYFLLLKELGMNATVYLGDHCFDSGLVDFFRAQLWFPTIKRLAEVPAKTPAVGFFDFPIVFNTQPDHVPPPAPFKSIGQYHHDAYRVGICHAARSLESPFVADGVYRTLTADQHQTILTQSPKDIQFVSLLKVEGESWSDTVKKIMGLDLIITVDTAVMHLAASLGVPTWVMLSGVVDAKFGEDKCPWYPKLKIFRNRDFGFDRTVADVVSALNQAY